MLAAGQSARLGQPKQLVKFAQQSLIRRQAKLALSFTENVYCIVGFSAESMQAELKGLPVKVVVNSNWQEGLSSSISAGVKILNEKVTSVLIVLVDQWQLTVNDFHFFSDQRLNDKTSIIAASRKKEENGPSKLGPPVLFPQQYFSELTALTGDKGAKPLLKKYAHLVHHIEMPHAFIDIDTPAQLEYFYQHQ